MHRHERESAPRDAPIVTGPTLALLGLGIILTASTLVWMISVRLEDASIADICWGLGFVLLAWLLPPVADADTAVLAGRVLITLWGARLSLHIFRRNHGKGEDPRYRAMRASHGRAFWWRSLFTVFWLQGAILWFVALPLLVAVRASSPAALTAVDGLGVLLFAVGFGFEVVGDYQLERFRGEPSNRGKVLDRGLWRYTRHPNYFGDATLWWGLYAIAAATPSGWLTVLSPALMTFLLMRVSGVTLLEDGLKASKPGYRRTSPAHRRSSHGFRAFRGEPCGALIWSTTRSTKSDGSPRCSWQRLASAAHPTIVARIEHPTRPWAGTRRPVQGDVTTIARQVRPPLRRYACGTVESKYIESPAASACSSTPMCTLRYRQWCR